MKHGMVESVRARGADGQPLRRVLRQDHLSLHQKLLGRGEDKQCSILQCLSCILCSIFIWIFISWMNAIKEMISIISCSIFIINTEYKLDKIQSITIMNCQFLGFAMRERTSGAATPPAQRSHRVWQPCRPPWYHQQGQQPCGNPIVENKIGGPGLDLRTQWIPPNKNFLCQ